MRALGVLLAAALGLAAQTPDQLLLARIRLHMTETLSKQPDYTCLETVERSHRDSATRKFQLSDTLRLEVALVNGKEMFAWPGSKNFEDTDLRELVPTGTFGNGNFALHARSVFESNSPTFGPAMEAMLDGKPAVRFDFRVPRMVSGYQLRLGDIVGVAGYHGSFYADPQSLDLRRLEVIADDIPPDLRMSAASDRMDYARVSIGASEFLLPSASELMLVDLNGQESRNRTRFTSCRQFTGKSVLTFGDIEGADSAAPAPKREIVLPRNLTVSLKLSDELKLDDAAVGDPVRAELAGDIKVKGQVLMTKGALATGRISRLDRYPEGSVLGLTFFDLESSEAHAALSLEFDHIIGIDAFRGPRLMVFGPPRPHEGCVILRPGHVRLSRGILIVWRT